MPTIPLSGFVIEIDPADLPPGPPGPPAPPAVVMSQSTLTSTVATTFSGTALFTGMATPVSAGSALLVSVTCDVGLVRAYEAVAGDLLLEERRDTGAGFGSWASVGVMRGLFNPSGSGAVSVEQRAARALQADRPPVEGLVAVQYRLVSSGVSANPAATLTLFPGAAIRIMEVRA